MIESWIPDNTDYYSSDVIFVLNEDEASPPLGYDCWEPKKTEAKNETTKI